MPLEYRLIQFRDHEIAEAVDRWLRANGELNQYGQTGGVEKTVNAQKISLKIDCWEMHGRQKRNIRRRDLTHDEVGQAIVLYCKNNSIPLSRQGRKVFRLMDGQIVMYYQLT